MPTTKISDVIIPEIFVPYVIKRTAELSELIQSGIISQSPQLNDFITGGGKTINMPFWNDLSGEDQALDDVNPIRTQKITANKDVAHVLIRANGWSSHELASALAGDNAQAAIIELVAKWWIRREQAILISVLNGIFASTEMADLVLSPSTSVEINAGMVLDAKQLLGDAFRKLSAIAMHSATYTKLQKEGAIVMMPNQNSNIGPREEINFPTYLGYRVIIDDGMPVSGSGSGAIYSSYLFGEGVIARGEGVPEALTPVEFDRDSAMSTDYLFHRRALVMHPTGIKWIGVPEGATPTNVELAAGTNWQRVVERKQIGIVKINHLI